MCANGSLSKIIDDLYDHISNEMSEFQERGSGWSPIEIVHLEININKYQPIMGSNCFPLPNHLANRKACISVRNNDVYCLKWALISAFAKVEQNIRRPALYKRKGVHNIKSNILTVNRQVLNFTGLKFITPVNSIKAFEENNPEISITVLGLDIDGSTIIGHIFLRIIKLTKYYTPGDVFLI